MPNPNRAALCASQRSKQEFNADQQQMHADARRSARVRLARLCQQAAGPLLTSRADTPAPVPSACISVHLLLICVEILACFAARRTLPHQRPRAARGKNPMEQTAPAPAVTAITSDPCCASFATGDCRTARSGGEVGAAHTPPPNLGPLRLPSPQEQGSAFSPRRDDCFIQGGSSTGRWLKARAGISASLAQRPRTHVMAGAGPPSTIFRAACCTVVDGAPSRTMTREGRCAAPTDSFIPRRTLTGDDS